MAIVTQEIIDSSKLSYNTNPIKIEIADEQKAKLIQGFINGIYADGYSWIREIICNAIDANNDKSIQTGIKVNPVDLYFTQSLPMLSGINSFVIQDYGFGMDESDIQNIYSQFGTSTKMNTNDQIGNFGIGSKSPLKYSSVFYLETSKDNMTYVYSIGSINHEDYGISLLTKYESDKDENNEYITGTKVIIPLKSRSSYCHSEQENIKSFIKHKFRFNDEVNMKFKIDYDNYSDQLYNKHIIYENDNFILIDYFSSLSCLYGILRYEIDELYKKSNNSLKLNTSSSYSSSSYSIIPKFKIGELKPVQSREMLVTDEFNINAFNKKLDLIQQDLIKLYEEELTTQNDELNNVNNKSSNLRLSTKLFFNHSLISSVLKYNKISHNANSRYQLHGIFFYDMSQYNTFKSDIDNIAITDESIKNKQLLLSKLYDDRNKIFKVIHHKTNKNIYHNAHTIYNELKLYDILDKTSTDNLTNFVLVDRLKKNKELEYQIIIGDIEPNDLYKYYRYIKYYASNPDSQLANEYLLTVNLELLKQYNNEAKQLGFSICSDELISDFETYHYTNEEFISEIEETEDEDECKAKEKPVPLGKLKYISGFHKDYRIYEIENIVKSGDDNIHTLNYCSKVIEFRFTENNFNLAECSKDTFVIYSSTDDSDVNEFALFYIKYHHIADWKFFKLGKKHISYCKKNNIGVYYKDVDKDVLNLIDYCNYTKEQLLQSYHYLFQSMFPNTISKFESVFNFLDIRFKYNEFLTAYNTKHNIDFNTYDNELVTLFKEFYEYVKNFNLNGKKNSLDYYLDWFKIINQHYGNKFD